MAAALKGDADIVQILLSAGADIKVKDKDEDTANLAAQNGHSSVVQALLAGADLNLQVGRDGFDLSSRSGRTQTVRVLLDHGAAVNGKNLDSRTASCKQLRRVICLLPNCC